MYDYQRGKPTQRERNAPLGQMPSSEPHFSSWKIAEQIIENFNLSLSENIYIHGLNFFDIASILSHIRSRSGFSTLLRSKLSIEISLRSLKPTCAIW
jgi:hypothetical protein